MNENHDHNPDLKDFIDLNGKPDETPKEEVLSEEEVARREKLQDEAMRNFSIASENILMEETQGKKPQQDIPEKNKVRPIPQEDREKGDDSKHIGKIVRFFVNLIIAAILVYGSYMLGRNGYVLNIGGNAQVTPYPTASAGQSSSKTTFTIVDLEKYVESLKPSQTTPFSVSVEDYYGYECLCLTSGQIKIYYRNEYPEGYTENKRAVIDNGRFRTELYYNYDLTADISSLVPLIGSFGANGSRQLLFIRSDETGYPLELSFIDADKLFNYGKISFEESIRANYKLSFTEEPGTQDSDTRNLLTFTFAGIPYTFSVSKETFVEGVMYDQDVIILNKGFKLDFSDSGISFSTEVTTVGGEYLGVVNGSAAVSGTDFVVSGLRFGAYSTAYEAGYGKDNVITPRTSPLPEYLTIISRNNERFYLPIIDDIKHRSIDFKDLVLNSEKGTYEYIVDGEVKSYCGIDVSKFQGEIDWQKVKDWGVDFAIIRMGYRGYGEGTLEIDEYFERNVKEATKAGIKVGIYFFSQAINAVEAKEEAEFVLEHIKDYHIDYPVIIDTEDISTANARANNITIWDRTAVCRAFCDTIKEAGYVPMIYSSVRYMLTGIDLTQLDDIERWFAYYGTESRFPYDFSIFQYSDKGKVDGISSAVDLDISLIDYSRPKE